LEKFNPDPSSTDELNAGGRNSFADESDDELIVNSAICSQKGCLERLPSPLTLGRILEQVVTNER